MAEININRAAALFELLVVEDKLIEAGFRRILKRLIGLPEWPPYDDSGQMNLFTWSNDGYREET